MKIVPVPESFLNDVPADNGIEFVPYVSEVAVIKGRVSLNKHMISLITEGEKVMHVENETIHLTPDRILLLPAGNVLFTERLGRNFRIKSTMIFFDDAAVQAALELNNAGYKERTTTRQYRLFERDAYLHGFVESVNALMQQGLLNGSLKRVKLNELLLYLESKHPGALMQFYTSPLVQREEDRIRRVMEAHMTEQLSLSELAFLCHMSLPTFKRKFEQIYHESPARWLQIQRLTLAADRLRSKVARPGEVYLDAGYENHSSFSKAFKQYFGVLPKDYAL